MALKMTNEKRAEAFRLRAAGWTLQRIADRYGVTRQMISHMIRHDRRVVTPRIPPNKLDHARIVRMRSDGMSYKEIAAAVGCGPESARRIVRTARI